MSSDASKADWVEAALACGATISVQVLNECASIALRMFGMSVGEVQKALASITRACTVMPLTMTIHQRGLQVVDRYGFSVYDSLIAAAALESGCTTLYTEDLQHGQRIEKTIVVRNPSGLEAPGQRRLWQLGRVNVDAFRVAR